MHKKSKDNVYSPYSWNPIEERLEILHLDVSSNMDGS